MKIKRFTAKNTREAIRAVREAWGPEAVVLSNRQLDNQVEITAAIDFEESAVDEIADHNTPVGATESLEERSELATKRQYSAAGDSQSGGATLLELRREIADLKGLIEGELTQFAWRDLAQRNPRRAQLQRRLEQLGLARNLCSKLSEHGARLEDSSAGWKKALLELAAMLTPGHCKLLDQGGICAVVGSTGVGKTTTVAKLAARYAMRHGADQVGLITTDCFRIGGRDQLDTFGEALGIPVLFAGDRAELNNALAQLRSRSLILIDTAGMSQRDLELSEQFATLCGVGQSIDFYLALSATAQPAITQEILRVYSAIGLSGAVLTKVDEAASLGGILSALIEYHLPTMYVSNGQRVPEDLHVATPIELVKTARDLIAQTHPSAPENAPAGLSPGRDRYL